MNHKYKKTKKRKSAMNPAFRIVLIFILPSIIVRLAGAFLGIAWVGGLLQLILYVVCGYYAANAYYQTIRRNYPRGRQTEEIRTGAASGLALGIILSILMVVVLLITGPMVISLPFLAGGTVLICWIPYDVLSGLFLGALGGRIASNRKRR